MNSFDPEYEKIHVSSPGKCSATVYYNLHYSFIKFHDVLTKEELLADYEAILKLSDIT